MWSPSDLGQPPYPNLRLSQYLVTALVHVASSVVVDPQHWHESVRISICLHRHRKIFVTEKQLPESWPAFLYGSVCILAVRQTHPESEHLTTSIRALVAPPSSPTLLSFLEVKNAPSELNSST